MARRGAAPLAGRDVAEPRCSILPTDNGLDDPNLADGGRHLLDGRGVHVLTGLRRVGPEHGQGHLVELAGNVSLQSAGLLQHKYPRGTS